MGDEEILLAERTFGPRKKKRGESQVGDTCKKRTLCRPLETGMFFDSGRRITQEGGGGGGVLKRVRLPRIWQDKRNSLGLGAPSKGHVTLLIPNLVCGKARDVKEKGQRKKRKKGNLGGKCRWAAPLGKKGQGGGKMRWGRWGSGYQVPPALLLWARTILAEKGKKKPPSQRFRGSEHLEK